MSARQSRKQTSNRRARKISDNVLVHALKSINDCVSITDGENKILFVNDAFLKTYGYSNHELVGQDIAIVLSDKNPSKNKEIVPATLEGGWEGELINRRKDGTEFPIFLSTSVVRDEKNNAVAMIGVAKDITEHKRLEQAERDAAAQIRTIVEGTKAILFSTSPRGIVTYANDAAYHALSCSAGTLEGMHYLKFVYPEDRNRVHDTYLRQKRGELKNTYVEFRYVDSNGHIGWFEFLANWLESDGRIVGMSGVGQVITERKRAELALLESEEVYRTLVGASPDAITQTDLSGHILFASPKAKEFFGYPPEEDLTGRSILEWIAPADREKATSSFQQLLLTGYSADHEFILLRRGGVLFHGEVNAALIRSTMGNPKGVIITTRDITERKRAEEALRMFRYSIDQASDAVYWLDSDARIAYVNDQACGSLGYSREELLHMKLWDIDPRYPRERWALNWQRYELNRQGGTERVETVHRRKDGSEFEVEVVSQHIWLGEQQLHVAYVRDITTRKQAEKALRTSEAQLSNALTIAHLGPWEYDVENDLFIFNDHFYQMLHTTAEMEGGYLMPAAQYANRFVHPNEVSVVAMEIQKAIEATDLAFSRQLEHRIRYADGGIGHVAVRFFVIKDERGRTIRTYGVNQDITERRRAEERLRLTQFCVDRASVGIMQTDRDGRISSVNNHMCRLLGYSPEELSSMHIFDIDPNFPIERWAAHRKYLARTGSDTFETSHRRKDGTLVPVQVTNNYIMFEGEEYSISFVDDIAERKRQEEALRMFRFSIDQASDAVFWLDREGNIIYVNNEACRSLGYTCEELLRLRLWDIDPRYPRDEWDRRWEEYEAKRERDTTRLESVHCRKDGTLFQVEVLAQHMWFGERQLHVSFVRDITERKLAETALRISEEKFSKAFRTNPDAIAISRLQDGMYLEINNGFKVLTGYAEEEVLGKDSTELNIWANSDDRKRFVEDLLRDGEIKNVEARFRTKQGTVVAGLVSAAIIKVEGEPCVISITRDITERMRMEEALRYERNLLKALMDTIPDHVYFKDEQSRFLRISKSQADRFHLDNPGQAVGTSDFDYFSEEHARAAFQTEQEVMKTGRPVENLEEKESWPDGSETWVLTTKVPLHDGDGRIIGTFGVSKDITERKASEEIVSRALSWQNAIFEGSRDAIFVTDAHSRFIAVNAAACQLTGYSKDELLEMRIPNLHEDVDLDAFQTFHRRIMAGEEALTEARILRKDGRKVDTEFSNRPIDIGGVRYVHTAARDIRERKRAEEALKQSEDKYRQFFEQDLTGDFISSVEGEIVECNPAFARIFGFTNLEDAKRSKADSFHPSRDYREKMINLLRERKKLELYEAEGKRSDGKILYLIENLVGIFNEEGRLTHIRGYIFDNTERKNLEEELLHTQKMESIGTLASGIAHDFNNVLNNIVGFAQQLKKYPDDREKVIRYSDTIEKSAFRGADLAKRLLMFGRKKKRESKITEIDGIIDEILELTEETFPKSIVVQKELDSELKPVVADRGELYQALLNLTLNSRDALLDRKNPSNVCSIAIRACNRDVGDETIPEAFRRRNATLSCCVELSVSDNGVGIPEEIRDKIFDPFFTTKERGKGTGLGLSVVYNIVRNIGGVICVDSESGKGTTIRIFLPAAEGQLQMPTEKEDSQESKLKTGDVILLVDDDELMRELGTELLNESGYRTLVAKDGSEAIALYRNQWQNIALVILDVAMPGMDGGEVYTRLKSINPRLRAFFCTGYIHDTVIAPLLERREVRALEKPFNPVDFRKMVKTVLAS